MKQRTEELPVVLAVTGASGSIYARTLLDWLCASGIPVHLIFSAAAEQVVKIELGQGPEEWECAGVVRHRADDLTAAVASGSFLHRGMVICPCTMGTLAAVAGGISMNLIHRAADVTLKEKRPLIVVARETPLSTIHLENMLTLARAGATILPAMPNFYSRPRTIEDVADTVVGRIIDALRLSHTLSPRWEGRP
jgi:4-hydroxy-3-polyprenylbenzoate decarboxylase